MRIALLTTGGDAPGMNPAIRAVVRRALAFGDEVWGVESGFHGLRGNCFLPLDRRSVSAIVNRGGTMLKTLRCPAFREPGYRRECYANLARREIEALVIIGGNGSQAAARDIVAENGLAVACIPASIDNDVPGTEETIGFDTAVNTALQAVDRIRDTATSHERVFLVEVMGRESGFIALAVGLADGAEVILVPEVPTDIGRVVETLRQGMAQGKKSMIVVVAEGAADTGSLAREIAARYPGEVRFSVLGYIQRGGAPSARSRYLALLFGARAVEALHEGSRAVMVGLENSRVVVRDLAGALPERKLDAGQLQLAHLLGSGTAG